MHLTSFYSHARAAHDAAAAHGLLATARLADFGLELTGPAAGGSQVWQPRFLASVQGSLRYTSQVGAGTIGFAGWTPHPARQWPLALDKIAFKRHAIARALAVPAGCFDPDLIQGPFLIKQARSSFGEGIRGPYLEFDAKDPAHRLAQGEYYENFFVGLSAKAWCWGDACFAIHLHKPSVVVGDGASSLRELVERLPNDRGGHEWERIELLARLAGVRSRTETVAKAREVLVEFRYGSRYDPGFASNPNLFNQLRGTALGEQFLQAARVLSEVAADPGQRMPPLYTLDAVVDGTGTAHFLEMNCNPITHPGGYAFMFRDWSRP